MTTAAKKPDGLALLRAPFPSNQISKLPKQMSRNDQEKGRCEKGSRYSADGHYCGGYHARSIHLDYVGHAALTDRLLDADPEWTWEPVAFGPDGLPALDRDGGLWIRLTVCGVTRLGYGDAQGKTGGDAMKERIGDALRNAAMRFGAALELWHKGDLHTDANPDDEPVQTRQQAATPRPADTAPAADPVVTAKRQIMALGDRLGYDLDTIKADFTEKHGGDIGHADLTALTAYAATLQAQVDELAGATA